MKNKLLISLGLLALSWPAFAQTSDSVSYKNHLGIIASPQLDKFFTANRTLPLGLIYRRQLKPDQAVRLSVLGAYNRQTFTSTIDPEGLKATSTSLLEVMAGYEWQKELSKRWSLFYGSDVGIGFKNIIQEDEDKSHPIPAGLAHYTKLAKDKTVNLGIRPFAGLQFKIHKKLHLAAETAISANYSRREYGANTHAIVYSTGEDLEGGYENGIWKEYNLKYSPISNVQLIYIF